MWQLVKIQLPLSLKYLEIGEERKEKNKLLELFECASQLVGTNTEINIAISITKGLVHTNHIIATSSKYEVLCHQEYEQHKIMTQ